MEVTILNKDYDPVDWLQGFESFIWTERFSGYGDCEVLVPEEPRYLRDLDPGNHLHLDESNHLMIIDSLESVNADDSGKSYIKVIARSAEALLENRLTTPKVQHEPWAIDNIKPGELAQSLVYRICILGNGHSPLDVIPNLSYREISLSGRAGEDVDAELPTSTTLYKTVKDLCDSVNVGFRIHFDLDTKGYEFRVYGGQDRTTNQTENPLIFDERFETLRDTRYLKSNLQFKNVAYVSHSSRRAFAIIWPAGQNEPSGTNRRVMHVDANDIENPTFNQLRQRGRTELAKARRIDAFDGEAIPGSNLLYNRNYFMGDVGVMRRASGLEQAVMVTEHTWTYDQDGLRSFPTFKTLED